jgi:alpha-galactosidase
MKLTIVLICLFLSNQIFSQKFDNLALTPPMGWNSWNTFATDINEELIMGIADSIVSKGLKDAGYEYIVLDDGWMAMERDSNGNLVPDPIKFPNGIKHLADYVHSKGLKFGLYNCAGNKTCAGYPGSRGHEYQDAQLYALWGVDYLKYDWCNTGDMNAKEAYTTMRDALFAAGRPIVFSICEWGNNKPWGWGEEIGHLWRTSGDITPCFDCELDHGTWSSWGVINIVNMRNDIRQYSRPDGWNDYDMMEVGNGMTQAEDRTHFALWCMLNSPLILGNDVRSAPKQTIEILTNPDAIAINQDSLGIPAFLFQSHDSVDVWFKPLTNENWALLVVNRNDSPTDFFFDFNRHIVKDTIRSTKNINFSQRVFTIKNVYFNENQKTTKKILRTTIDSHDIYFVLLYTKKHATKQHKE